MTLVSGLRTLDREAWLLAPRVPDAAPFDRSWLVSSESGLPDINWECIVLDYFQTPPEKLARWKKLAPVIGIDEGGRSRNDFDFLIDILPNCSRIKPNIADPTLLPLPNKNEDAGIRALTGEGVFEMARNGAGPIGSLALGGRCEETDDQQKKILISFGQEDAAQLGPAVAQALMAKNSNFGIDLLQGGLSAPLSPACDPRSPLLQITESIPSLNEHLHEYALVITHFGLTAFEALYAGVPVLLVSPGAYHEKLAKKAGFCSLGIGKKAAKKLPCLLFAKNGINREFLHKLKKHCAVLAEKYRLDTAPQKSLAELINGVKPYVSRNCPVCGAPLRGPALARFTERSYRACKRCGIISMNRLNPPPVEYGREYFFEAYQKQYGKTYIEDFPHLAAAGKRRLAIIKPLLCRGGAAGGNAAALLDIGCAYGPFLAAARDEGFSPCGIDPAEDAVHYVTRNLNIPAIRGFFPLHEKAAGEYAVITLWYVIEHFGDCVSVFAEIHRLLKSGGVLAFSTPSSSGISGRVSLNRFLERSPADHWTIWSPSACIAALAMAGFTVSKTVNCGHHPERFPLLGEYARTKKSPLYWIFLAFSKIFCLGDTFEAYAMKN
jgi:2-polyprenyl-3-methyl-5-hydroxy-6-metoxy-1,4-benzoquinol methylase